MFLHPFGKEVSQIKFAKINVGPYSDWCNFVGPVMYVNVASCLVFVK